MTNDVQMDGFGGTKDLPNEQVSEDDDILVIVCLWLLYNREKKYNNKQKL